MVAALKSVLFLIALGLTLTDGCDPAALMAAGFEWRNEGFWKDPGDQGSFPDARSTCRAMGADLPMLKSSQDLAGAAYFFGKLGTNNLWVGLRNPTRDKCEGKTECSGVVQWIDGTTVYSNDVSHLEEIWGDSRLECYRMTSAGGFLNDWFCDEEDSDGFVYVCQGRCPNICDPPPDPPGNGKTQAAAPTEKVYPTYEFK